MAEGWTKMDSEKALSAELDLLPEHCHYQDAGCEMAKSCLDCPLPRCIYDTPRGKQVLLKQKRNGEITRLFREEARSISELAQLFAVSTRTVQRILKRYGLTGHQCHSEESAP